MEQNTKEFIHLFPLLINTLENSSRVLNISFQTLSKSNQELLNAYRRWKNECHQVIQEGCWNEIMNIMPNEWSKLNKVSHRVGNHTIRLMVCMYKDQEFEDLDNHDKNLLLWAALLHDLGKRSRPEVIKKDPFHPFPSCAIAISLFFRFGWLINDESAINNAISFINSAFILNDKNEEIMDNTKIPQILLHLFYIKKLTTTLATPFTSYQDITRNIEKYQLFELEILIIILFHQSIQVLKEYPFQARFENEHVYTFMTPRIIALLKILVQNDSLSYTFHNPTMTQYFQSCIQETYITLLNSFQIL